MAVADGQTIGGRLKETCLPFEGFLEALCRLAMLKALPTDAEIAEAGTQDAGTYMTWLRELNLGLYQQMLKERCCSFGELPRIQPLHRCVEHLITIIIRRIEGSQGTHDKDKAAGDELAIREAGDDVRLEHKEVHKWASAVFHGATFARSM